MSSSRNRLPLVLIALFSFGALAVALVSQYVFFMQPCAWCVLQRLIYLVIGLLAVLGLVGGRLAAKLATLLTVLLSAGGMVAGWYQYSVASHLETCAQTFADRFISGLGLDASVPTLFGIYAMCKDAMVTVLGVQYVVWSMALFAIILLVALAAFMKRR
ncbi:disulfide bond formation protein B [Bordetella sp. FB-8]|uniref:disulfide bond formation protein B n=1 Tax=Bordetella sp. FB-8 TaxID=1159870 RepID=UPI00047736AF|nr:disulfide bond formation protein B [Bordetella sp. FB-8]